MGECRRRGRGGHRHRLARTYQSPVAAGLPDEPEGGVVAYADAAAARLPRGRA